MMLSSASHHLRHVGRRATVARRGLVTASSHANLSSSLSACCWMAAAGAAAAITVCAVAPIERTSLEALTMPPIEEPKTGIMFPYYMDVFKFVGCGVRIKYGFVKVYAVGTYANATDMAALQPLSKEDRIKALLDPKVPRTIRIVMNRGLSIEKYTSAIVEALEPRMNGQDMEALELFRKMSVDPPVDLKEGDEIKMTITGDLLHYRTAGGGGGTIQSLALTRAMCDVYYGTDPVSPGHLESVLAGIDKM